MISFNIFGQTVNIENIKWMRVCGTPRPNFCMNTKANNFKLPPQPYNKTLSSEGESILIFV